MEHAMTSTETDTAGGTGMSGSARAWAGFQGGRDPYITLVSIYIFMPYVATVLVGDAVKGQGLIAAYGFLGGLVAALTAPFLGAAAGRIGPPKTGRGGG